MALYDVQQSTVLVPLVFPLNSTASGNPPLTGATPTVLLSKNGAAYASPAGAVSEIGGGLYKVAGNATDSNTLGILWLHATATGAVAQDVVYGVINGPLVDSNREVSANNLDITVVAGAVAGSSGGSGSTPEINALPPPWDIFYPRNQQVSFRIYLSVPITGRTISWNVRTSKTATTALLTKDNAGVGGIVLNTSTETFQGKDYVANQIATVTILPADCSDTTIFPNQLTLWQGWELTGPPEKPAIGRFVCVTEP